MKPTSKAISVTSSAGEYIYTTTVACEDGSVWEYTRDGRTWECILEAPTPPKSDLPMPGSKWKMKKRNQVTTITGLYIEDLEEKNVIVNHCDDDEIYDQVLEDFLEFYEPIPQEPKEGANDE